MALTCEELRRRLDEDAPLDQAEALRHLEGCTECRAAVARAEAVSARLREWGETGAPPFLHGRVMAHVRADRSAHSRGREGTPFLRRGWWAAPTLAAALLVATVVWRVPQTAVLAPTLPDGSPAAVTASASPSKPPAATPDGPTPSAAATSGPASGPDSALGVLRGGSAAADSAATAGAIACELVSRDRARSPRRVALHPRLAPPRGLSWTVVVAPSGEVQPASREVPPDTLEELAALDLPPGRYVLRRAR